MTLSDSDEHDEHPNGSVALLATLAAHQRKFWQLAVLVSIVTVAALFYFVYLGSIRADDIRAKNEKITQLEAENEAVRAENNQLSANLDQLKIHTVALTQVIEALTGVADHTAVDPHAGVTPDTPNPHGG